MEPAHSWARARKLPSVARQRGTILAMSDGAGGNGTAAAAASRTGTNSAGLSCWSWLASSPSKDHSASARESGGMKTRVAFTNSFRLARPSLSLSILSNIFVGDAYASFTRLTNSLRVMGWLPSWRPGCPSDVAVVVVVDVWVVVGGVVVLDAAVPNVVDNLEASKKCPSRSTPINSSMCNLPSLFASNPVKVYSTSPSSNGGLNDFAPVASSWTLTSPFLSPSRALKASSGELYVALRRSVKLVSVIGGHLDPTSR
mmetsp:Transcript_31028/g.85501  ORF Transcript_31028/g.85501 Transcript_31028/m.85501 type:complete len:257 (-) Transcript_31028:1189-1959(-)